LGLQHNMPARTTNNSFNLIIMTVDAMQKDHFPRMMRVRQTFDRTEIEDVGGYIRSRIRALEPRLNVRSGQTVAIACSSRGLAEYLTIVKTVVAEVARLGLKPFIVPAMGSHGAGTAEGQQRVLEHLGIREENVGAPIRSALEVVQLGETHEGIPVCIDRLAHEADHIVLINRIKKHTDFIGEVESGLLKLMVIGLGKMTGAEAYHQSMLTFGASHAIRMAAQHILKHCNILFGVGTVENGYGKVADIGVAVAEDIEGKEKQLFQFAKKLSPKLPFDEADIILIDEIGKEISGAGFDTRVVGRIRLLGTPEPDKPIIKRIILSDLTETSTGNACGFGNADIITQRLADKVDQPTTDTNTIVSLALEMGKTPLIMPNDQEALALSMRSVGLIPPARQKIMRIKNTLHLAEVDLSEAYADAVDCRTDLEIIRPIEPLMFLPNGYLNPF